MNTLQDREEFFKSFEERVHEQMHKYYRALSEADLAAQQVEELVALAKEMNAAYKLRFGSCELFSNRPADYPINPMLAEGEE